MPGVDHATVSDVRAAKTSLRRSRRELLDRPAAEIARILGRVGERFLRPDDTLRRAALETLPEEAGLSEEMAAAILDGMAADWTAERLARLLTSEFGQPSVLDGITGAVPPATEPSPRRAMAVGPALCVQISSGGVPGVGVNALIRSLLVKAPTLIKPGAGDLVLTRLFARGLREADPAVGAAAAVRYWPGDVGETTAAAVEGADLVVAYGSDESVASVRSAVPVTSRFVPYHHRFGVGLVGRDALEGDARDVADKVARAVAMFEHRGCVCPQIVFVEEGGGRVAERFAELVAESLSSLETEWPSSADPAVREPLAASLRQVRDTVEIQQAAGGARLLHGGSAPWTVVFESELVQVPALPGRAVRIRAVGDLSDVPEILGPSGRHLQSVGYAGVGERITRLAEDLGRAGASRVVPFERVSFPPPWWLHDGQGPLQTLVRWVEVE